MKIKKARSTIVFNITGYILILLVTAFCLLPFLLIISGSVTSNESITRDGYHLIPRVFSTSAYKTVLMFPEGIIRAYGVTLFVTVTGTLAGLFLISMAGYVLCRKDFRYRNKISFFIYFTTLFQGGLIPWYILLTKYLKLHDSYLALILPGLMSPFLIILMRSFMKMSIPEEIIDSAKIDGAGDFKIYHSIVIYLSGPGIATIALFLGLAYWNDWFMSMLYISSPDKYSLQFYLYNMLNASEFMRKMSQGAGLSIDIEIPRESTKMAMSVIVIGPIIFLYPFIQKYFVKGLTVGAVKG